MVGLDRAAHPARAARSGQPAGGGIEGGILRGQLEVDSLQVDRRQLDRGGLGLELGSESGLGFRVLGLGLGSGCQD